MAHKYPNKQEALSQVKGKNGKISDKTHEGTSAYTGYVNKSKPAAGAAEALGTPIPPDARCHQSLQRFRDIRSISPSPWADGKNHELTSTILAATERRSGKFAQLVDRTLVPPRIQEGT